MSKKIKNKLTTVKKKVSKKKKTFVPKFDEMIIIIENMETFTNAYQFTDDAALKEAVRVGQIVVNENMEFFRLGSRLQVSVNIEDVAIPTKVLKIA